MTNEKGDSPKPKLTRVANWALATAFALGTVALVALLTYIISKELFYKP